MMIQYDSKHEEKEEEDNDDDDDEEEAPSPMARDLDALSKMSSLRADEGGDKPSRRPEEKPEQVASLAFHLSMGIQS